jgi:hypothetical protein
MAHPTDRTHYAKITTQASQVDADLTDYPMCWDLSLITDQTWWDNIKSDGGDLMVYTEAGARVAVELDDLDTVAKTGWVHWLSSPSASVDQAWRIWVGNASASQPAEDAAYGRENVWPSDYVMVHHMTGASATALDDSTSNNNDVTGEAGTPDYDQAGKVGNAVNLDGSTEYLTIADSASLTFAGDITLSAWVYRDTDTTTNMVMAKMFSASNEVEYRLQTSATTGEIEFAYHNGSAVFQSYLTTTASVAAGAWHHVAFVLDIGVAGSAIAYWNGAAQSGSWASGTGTGAFKNGTRDLRFGQMEYTGFPQFFDGRLDELRISTAIKTGTWISTEFNNQNAPGTFNVYGGVFGTSHRNRVMSVA